MGKLFFMVLLFIMPSLASAQIPVIIRATATEQTDTTGCNFVRELCRITYDAIISGKAKLWNSNQKEIEISGQSLKEIERSSQTSFTDQEVVFIYEYWSNNEGVLRSNTTGFLFSGKTRTGQDVEYGYVDFNDVQPAFLGTRMELNANGNYTSTLLNYINSKSYNYKLLQFAGKVIDNVKDSRLIMENYVGNSKFNSSSFSQFEVPQKLVNWTLDYSVDKSQPKAARGNSLLAAIEQFLRSNEEVFYNLGGDRVIGSSPKLKWKVNRIEVNELWKKVNGTVLYDLVGITFYVNDSALAEIPFRDFSKYEIKVDDKSWNDCIVGKDFNYIIRRINSQDISRSEAYLYQKALFNEEWSKLTLYVSGP